MIKIHETLWYICRNNKRANDDLAYMTYYADDKAFTKRATTGLNWATERYATYSGTEGHKIKNEPIKGHYIGDSVSRYSTQNKLFRVADPRGFTVEVPTGNIANLLRHATLVNGVVQGECIWATEDGNHYLVPIASDLYKEIKAEIDEDASTRANFIPFVDLAIGDVVELYNEYFSQYIYCGKFKVEYLFSQNKNNLRWDNPNLPDLIIPDPKPTHIFAYKMNDGRYLLSEFTNSKVVRKLGYIPDFDLFANWGNDTTLYSPQRVLNQLKKATTDWKKYNYNDGKAINIAKLEK